MKTLFAIAFGCFLLGTAFIIYTMLVISGRGADIERTMTRGDPMLPWDGRCPDCKQTKFYEGPEGGTCINIECANPTCRTRLNVASIPGHPLYERIGKGEARSS